MKAPVIHRNMPLRTGMFTSPRIKLVGISTVRVIRGCNAETVLKSVGDAMHPNFIRWAFDISVKPARTRELRFWMDEICGDVDKWAEPEIAIGKILGERKSFPRTEIEIQWITSAITISHLVRAGEIAEVNHQLTHTSLVAFLERRLQ
jgi:hypothetical protein